MALTSRALRLPAARQARSSLLAAGLVLALGGCEDTRKVLGMDKNPPDEFRIVSRPPLTIPPDYSLRPPQPGAARPQTDNPRDTARSALLEAGGVRGANAGITTGGSEGETSMVQRVAAGSRVDPSIRQTLERETAQLAETDTYLLERLMWWRTPQDPGVVVDPQRESQRLRQAQATGQPPNSGDTPTIQRRQRGLLEGIF
jgi:hypothetical protein